jgi:hypothetical protein
MLDAVTGEARRAITTSSLADRHVAFSGILTKKGAKIAESDAISLPLQFMSYGVAAHNKILQSGLQGRDRGNMAGIASMLVMGLLANYLRTAGNAYGNKSVSEHVLGAYETSGLGGTWFGDMNNMLENASHDTLGIRPLLGMDPKFGKQNKNQNSVFNAAGPAASQTYQLSRLFWDNTISSTRKAQIIRSSLPYAGLWYLNGITRSMATQAALTWDGK